MILISIIAGLVLFFSFIGGITQGAVKSFFSIIAFIIALPVTGLLYIYPARLLSFLPGRDWENFLGFFITLAIAAFIFQFLFFLPRKIVESIWKRGPVNRLLGGLLNLLSAAIGLTVLAIVLAEYPVWDWLQRAVAGSTVMSWLVANLDFVRNLFQL